MVAVMHQSSSLRNCLNYNEQKVKTGDARCLDAGYYPMDAGDMNFYQKLARLEKLTELNQTTRRNSVHFSLNFHPSENLSEDILRALATEFLEKIGFAEQPYLLYQHFDAGHPHIHLVTTNIKADGKAINLHNLGKVQVKQAREELEVAYSLVKADRKQEREISQLKPVNVQRVQYGRMETKRAIAGVLNSVIKNYKFSSLAQLNAVLGLYHIVADVGNEGSRIREHNGLVYRVLDEEGNRVGVPIRASDFFGKPTQKSLQEKFAEKEALKKTEHRVTIRNAVDMALLNGKVNLTELARQLKKLGIDLVIRKNADGVVYGITYVDHKNKVVFNGSELGKSYSAKAILERCGAVVTGEEKNNIGQSEKVAQGKATKGHHGKINREHMVAGERKNTTGMALIETLLEPEYQAETMDWNFKRKKKKKKRQRISSE